MVIQPISWTNQPTDMSTLRGKRQKVCLSYTSYQTKPLIIQRKRFLFRFLPNFIIYLCCNNFTLTQIISTYYLLFIPYVYNSKTKLDKTMNHNAYSFYFLLFHQSPCYNRPFLPLNPSWFRSPSGAMVLPNLPNTWVPVR